jgi:hypothetical protein
MEGSPCLPADASATSLRWLLVRSPVSRPAPARPFVAGFVAIMPAAVERDRNMRTRRRVSSGLVKKTAIVIALGFVALPAPLQAKGGSGVVILQGAIDDVQAESDALSFAFTGKLSFTFFTAPFDDPDRERVELTFNAKKLAVRVPKFGSREYDHEGCRYRVTYKNASENASEAARLRQTVNIALFRPKLVYGAGGVIERVDATHAQVLSEQLERQLRDHGFPAECPTP